MSSNLHLARRRTPWSFQHASDMDASLYTLDSLPTAAGPHSRLQRTWWGALGESEAPISIQRGASERRLRYADLSSCTATYHPSHPLAAAQHHRAAARNSCLFPGAVIYMGRTMRCRCQCSRWKQQTEHCKLPEGCRFPCVHNAAARRWLLDRIASDGWPPQPIQRFLSPNLSCRSRCS